MSRFPLTKSDHISIIWNSFHHINVNNFHMNFTINIYVLCDINNTLLQIFFGYKKSSIQENILWLWLLFITNRIWSNFFRSGTTNYVSIQFYMWNDVIRLPQDKHLNDDTHTIITSFLFFLLSVVTFVEWKKTHTIS